MWAISEHVKSTGHFHDWATTKIFGQENHILSRKSARPSTSTSASRPGTVIRDTTAPQSTERSCNLITKAVKKFPFVLLVFDRE